MDEADDELVVPSDWLETCCKRKFEESPDSESGKGKHPRLAAQDGVEDAGLLPGLAAQDGLDDAGLLPGLAAQDGLDDAGLLPRLAAQDGLDDAGLLPRLAAQDGLDDAGLLPRLAAQGWVDDAGLLPRLVSENGVGDTDLDAPSETLENPMMNEPDSGHSVVVEQRGDTSQNSLNNHCSESSIDQVCWSTNTCTAAAASCGEDDTIIRDAKIIASIVPGQDLPAICKLLVEHRHKENRLDVVAFQLTNQEEDQLPAPGPAAEDLFEAVQQVLQAVPLANVNQVYAMLEVMPPSASRVPDLISSLMLKTLAAHEQHASSVQAEHENSSTTTTTTITAAAAVSDHLHLENDPLFEDMRTIARMFPDKDRNEIYALLEANFSQQNRIESVVNEILRTDSQPLPTNQQDVSGADVREEVRKLSNIFPDCDPNYLYEKLYSMQNEPERMSVLATEMFDKKDYPKLKDLLEQEKAKEVDRRARNMNMTVDQFLLKFPQPVTTFRDSPRPATEQYKQHAQICLYNEFPGLKRGYLRRVLNKHHGHLYPAYQEISALLVRTPLYKQKQLDMFKQKSGHYKIPMPDTADEYFYHELWFVRNELSVLDHIKAKENERKVKVARARISGQLYECFCCFDDECLLEDMTNCPEGHLFCKTCLVRSTEAAFGEMKTRFPCLTGGCDQFMPLSTLQSIIPANLFSKILRRLQEEEVQQANIPDLVTCPFCPFAAIMTNPHDKVFKCLNPECLKESCRLCQEVNHIPLRCNEVEKKAATDMRVYIENMISEAVMRKCHKCGKRFVKEDGCNKMTCVCGATSCYACKKAGIDYSHFQDNNKCANEDPETIHRRDMEEAAIRAKNQYLLDHPEAADVELKVDVPDMIKNYKKFNGTRKFMPAFFHQAANHYNDLFENDDDDEDDDSDDDEDGYY